MPNLTVIRPADSTEVKGAWAVALHQKGPVALVLSRQGVPDLAESQFSGVEKGGYILKDGSQSKIDFCLISSGSEVSLALEVAQKLEEGNHSTRVVSMPSFELFNQQTDAYQESVLGRDSQFVSIEAQSSFGWHQYIGKDGIAISIDTFGLSAPKKSIEAHFGFTVEGILKTIKELVPVT